MGTYAHIRKSVLLEVLKLQQVHEDKGEYGDKEFNYIDPEDIVELINE